MKSYILVVIFVATCGIAVCQANMDEWKKTAKECMDENNATFDEFKDIKSGKTKAADASEGLQCTVKCIMEKSGFMNAAGELQPEVIKEKLGEHAKGIDATLEKCQNEKGINPCNRAMLVSDCMWKDHAM